MASFEFLVFDELERGDPPNGRAQEIAPARNAKKERITNDDTVNRQIDGPALGQLLLPVVEPSGTSVEPWRNHAAEATIMLAIARERAISSLSDLPDETFRVARSSHLSVIMGYGNEWENSPNSRTLVRGMRNRLSKC